MLTAVVPSIQTPLASAAELADATGGNGQKFRAFMAPYVGPGSPVCLGLPVASGSLQAGADRGGGHGPDTGLIAEAGTRGLRARRAAPATEHHGHPGLGPSEPRLRVQHAGGQARVCRLRGKPASQGQALGAREQLGLLGSQLRAVPGSFAACPRPARDQPAPLSDQGPSGVGRGPVRRQRVYAGGHSERTARRHVLRRTFPGSSSSSEC